MSETDSEEPSYRFKWSFIGEANFLFSGDCAIYCVFSQAILSDRHLLELELKISEEWETEEFKRDSSSSESGDNVAVASTGEIMNSMGVDEISHGNVERMNKLMSPSAPEQPVEGIEIDMAELGLPTKFDRKESNRRKKRKDRSNFSYLSWLYGLTWEDYWTSAGEYITYKTWINDYGSQMDEQTMVDFRQGVLLCQPANLLPEHVELKEYSLLAYADADKEYLGWDDLFACHCEAVKEKAKLDFETYKKRSASYRCQSFLHKIRAYGFATQCSISDPLSMDNTEKLVTLRNKSSLTVAGDTSNFSSESNTHDKGNNEITDCVKKLGTASKNCRRFLVNYNDMDTFNDISYDFYEDPYTSRSNVSRSKSSIKSLADSKNSNGTVAKMVGTKEPLHSLTFEEKLSFDYGFDEERDADLVAMNAYKIYHNDEEIKKYWFQRYRLFSKLHHGILMDREGWFSVTPERIAEHIADRVVLKKNCVVVDAFAGVGGNTIQLACRGAYVIALDLDPIRLRCALRNAQIYNVADRINFICADFFHFAQMFGADAKQKIEDNSDNTDTKEVKSEDCYPVDAVFLSPPWGGPSYLQSEVFDLNADLTPNGFEIFTAAKLMSPNIAYFLPRNTSVTQLVSMAGLGGSCEIEKDILNKKFKTLTAYYGNLVAHI